MNKNITHIIFDRHGVLDMTSFVDELVIMTEASGIPVEDIVKKLYDVRMQYDCGQIDFEKVREELKIRLGIDEKVCDVVFDNVMTIDHNEALRELLPKLAESYRLSILSDCPPEKTHKIMEHEDLSVFQEIYFSSDHGMTKDTDEFFTKLLDTLGLDKNDYDKVLFVDDSPSKIAKAKKIGLAVCEFATIDDLTSMLGST